MKNMPAGIREILEYFKKAESDCRIYSENVGREDNRKHYLKMAEKNAARVKAIEELFQ